MGRRTLLYSRQGLNKTKCKTKKKKKQNNKKNLGLKIYFENKIEFPTPIGSHRWNVQKVCEVQSIQIDTKSLFNIPNLNQVLETQMKKQ